MAALVFVFLMQGRPPDWPGRAADFLLVQSWWPSSDVYFGGNNGTIYLDTHSVQDDQAADSLSANGAALDWFFAHAGDQVSGLNGSDVNTLI